VNKHVGALKFIFFIGAIKMFFLSRKLVREYEMSGCACDFFKILKYGLKQ
jgi:hypothetical protein